MVRAGPKAVSAGFTKTWPSSHFDLCGEAVDKQKKMWNYPRGPQGALQQLSDSQCGLAVAMGVLCC
jgi:hypothetical protein